MTDLAALRSLRERVLAAEGPCRELDALVLCTLLAPAGSKVEQSHINGAWCVYEPRPYGPQPFRLWETPFPFRLEHASVTASIDAAVALVERVLPGWHWLRKTPGVMTVYEPPPGKQWAVHHDKRAANDALGLIVALLSALIARAETGVEDA